jgi:hypothetical protein
MMDPLGPVSFYWVDFSWELVREECYDVKQIFVVIESPSVQTRALLQRSFSVSTINARPGGA